MNKKWDILIFLTFLLACFSLISIIFIMISILFFREQIFIYRDTFSRIEIAILLGLLLIFLFHIFSLILLHTEIRESNSTVFRKWTLFLFGIFSLFLFIGEKVMVDEIAHEYVAGWPVIGEWMILYILFIIQLIYNSIILFRLKPID